MDLSISERMYILKTLPHKTIKKACQKLNISTDEFWRLLRKENELPEALVLSCKKMIIDHKKSKQNLDNDLFD